MQVHRRADFAGVRAECAHPGVRAECAHPARAADAEEATRLRGGQQVRAGAVERKAKDMRKRRVAMLKAASVNAGGASGTWRVLDWLSNEAGGAYDVVCIQEISMTEAEARAFGRVAAKKGYNWNYQLGYQTKQRWKGEREKGGCGILVRKELQQTAARKWAQGKATVIGQRVCGWQVGSGYAPPTTEALQDLAELMQTMVESEKLASRYPWAMAGDWNTCAKEKSADCPSWAVLKKAGGRILEPGEGTRWGSDQVIDWIISNKDNGRIEGPKLLETHISDHKILTWKMHAESAIDRKVGTLQRSPMYKRPSNVTASQWKEMLEMTWEKMEEQDATTELRLRLTKRKGSDIDTDKEWELWNSLLCQCYRDTVQRVLDEEESKTREERKLPNTEVDKLKHQLKMKRSKGRAAKHIHFDAKREEKDGTAGLVQRKRRKWIARAYNLIGRIRKLSSPSDLAQDKKVQKVLAGKGVLTNPLTWSDAIVDDLQKSIEAAKLAAKRKDEQAQRDRLRAWRNRMKSGVKEIGAWLRQKKAAPLPTIIGAETRKAACEQIKEHWHGVWDGRETQKYKQEINRRMEAMAHELPKAEIKWRRPTEEEMEAAIRKASGSGGTDGWIGEEARAMPRTAIQLFNQLTERWEVAGEVPSGMREARQVNLSKPGKEVDGKLAAANTRPITVFSVMWRVYCSAWVSSPAVREWQLKVLPEEICGGQGAEGAEEASAALLDAFQEMGLLATLDYSQCYDLMDPATTLGLMRKAGFPVGLVRVLEKVWCHQKRWVSWDNYVHPEPLEVRAATPQGDPWGPFSLNLWMVIGRKAVEDKIVRAEMTEEPENDGWQVVRRRLRKKKKEKIYMDDRTWAEKSAKGIFRSVDAWQEWSTEVGLKENPTKIQLMAKNQRYKDELVAEATARGKEKAVTDELEALGVTAVKSTGRKIAKKEAKRVQEAKETIQQIRTLPLSRTDKKIAIRTFALPKFSYGWVGQAPPRAVTDTIDAAIWKTLQGSRASSRRLRNILEGGMLNARAVYAQRTVGLLVRRLRRDSAEVEWKKAKGTHVYEVRRMLKSYGWEEAGPWKWRHKGITAEIDLPDAIAHWRPCNKGKLMHLVRESFRWTEWEKFRKEQRNAAKAVKDVAYSSVRTKRTREWADTNVKIVVATGGIMSPMAMVQTIGTPFPTNCPWCSGSTAHHNHVFWECTSRPSKLKKPVCPLQARLGWPTKANTQREVQHDKDILAWMEECAIAIWTRRYGEWNSGSRYKGSQCQGRFADVKEDALEEEDPDTDDEHSEDSE